MIIDIIPWWFYPIFVWTIAWRIIACWQAAKRNQLYWFIFIFVFNTLGVMPILYLLFFRDMKSLDYLKVSKSSVIGKNY